MALITNTDIHWKIISFLRTYIIARNKCYKRENIFSLGINI